MVYLDYSATTKVSDNVLERFNYICQSYFGNPNSNHTLGISAKKIIDEATKKTLMYMNAGGFDVIYTSGASESNNLAIKGVMEDNTRNEIITTKFEHSSILSPLSYLQKKGCIVHFVNVKDDGTIDIDNLENLINDNTALISIGAVNSELGIRQPIEEIGKLLKKYPSIVFHSDITQILGKDNVVLDNVDLASFSAHKIYGFKGIGGLLKKNSIKLIPLIHGGKSTTIYRSGTPSTGLIDSISTALSDIISNVKENYDYVKNLNDFLKQKLILYPSVYINSTYKSIPHILNFSIVGVDSDDLQKYLEENNIYISTKSACSSSQKLSASVLELTNDEKRAKSSVRISISYKTTMSELQEFLEVFDRFYNIMVGDKIEDSKN